MTSSRLFGKLGRYSLGMLVADLYHFLDLPEETPGPTRRLPGHLSNIVRAATAGDAGTAWTTALPCPRRPAHRPCAGRMIVLRPEPPAPIRWQCSVCALRELLLLDTDSERLVFAMRTNNHRIILPATDDDLDELLAFLAAEANHEPSRPRRQRLDVALDALTHAQTNLHGT